MRALPPTVALLCALWGSAQAAPPGRYPLSSWGEALDTLTPTTAPLHLRTAGAVGDPTEPGALGDPRSAPNVQALAHADPEQLARWVDGPPLRQALLAQAAQWAPPGALLSRLLALVDPTAPHEGWPEGYTGLPPLPTLVRRAIERHGPTVIPLLLEHPRWAADRGLDAHGAARMAGLRLPERCAALPVAADRHLRAGRRLAAGLLLGEASACPHPSRLAVLMGDYWRAGAIAALDRGDLVGGLALMRRAWWISPDAAHGDMLADLMVDRARALYADGHTTRALALGDEAKALRPDRASVIRFRADLPSADARARAAVLIMGVLVLWFALRRLKGLYTPRKIRYRRMSYSEVARRRRNKWRRRRV